MAFPVLAQFASRGMVHLADAALRSILLACLAGLALRAFRVRHSGIQLAAWTGVLYAALAMPVLAWLLPPIPVHFRLPANRVAAGPSSLNDGTAQPNLTGPTDRIERSGRLLRAGRAVRTLRAVSVKAKTFVDWHSASAVSPVSAGNSSRQTSMAQALPQTGPQGNASLRLRQFASGLGRKLDPALTGLPRLAAAPAAIIYALGFIFLMGRLTLGLFLSCRLRRGSTLVDDPSALRWLNWHAVAMGARRVPSLAESSVISVPITFGVLHPVIVVPSDWRDWPSAKLSAVMAHEVSHIKRNDSRTRALALIYRSIFWFSPLGWWLESRLADLAEQASDQAAIRAGAEPTYYAEVLMSFFEISTTQGRVRWQGVSMARGMRAGMRIERVLSSRGAVPAAMRAPIVILLALCALPMVCLTAGTRPVPVAAADSAVSQPSQQTVANLQLPEPPPPAEPAPPADSHSAPPAPAAPPVQVAPPAPAPPAFSYATPLAPAAPLAPPTPQAAPPPAAPPAPDAPPPPQAAPLAPEPPADRVSTFTGTWNLSDVQPANLRLPRYPGSTPAPEHEAGLRTVRLKNCSVGDLAAARYVTNDSPEKVLNYYRQQMKSYGPVIQCDGGQNGEVYVELDGEALSNPRPCRPGEVGVGATELKVIGNGAQEIVAVKARSAGSEFAVVHVRAGSQPSGPDASADRVYEHLTQVVAAEVGPSAAYAKAPSAYHYAYSQSVSEAAAPYRGSATQASAAYAKAAGAYRYSYSQSAGTTVTNSEDDDDNWNFSTSSGGMDFAIASGKSVMMFGSGDDRDDVKSLQKKISGDFVWFIHDGNSYVIRDAATVKSAKALFAPMEELGKKQEALGKQQEELGKQEEEIGRQQEQVKVKVPADLEARLKKVEAEIRELGPSATQDDLARIQGELGDLQGYVGDLQGKAGDQQGELGSRQGELGEKQGELGRQQGELGEQQGRIAREGARKMQVILKHALDSGLAQRAPG